MEIIAGSYNNMLFGYSIDLTEDYKEKLSFTNEAHASLVKCLAISKGGILASAGNDEVVKIFNLVKRKEIGSLMHLNGSITDMSFEGNSYLFTSSETGEIAICDSKSWTVSHILKHKSSVLSFAIHESGKLLLSSCKDRTLQTWNLITGRRAFVTNLKHAAEIVRFSSDGNIFVTIYSSSINIYTSKDGKFFGEIVAPNRIISIIFVDIEILCVGCEGGILLFYNTTNCQLLQTISTGTTRIKSMVFTTSSHLVSATSDGFILIHLISIKNGEINFSLKKSISTSHRWLCVAGFEQSKELNLNRAIKKNLLQTTNLNDSNVSVKRKAEMNTEISKCKKSKKIDVKAEIFQNCLDNKSLNRKEVNDDSYDEDDGSCPSNDEESDEEKSFKNEQLKLKRSLKNQSESINKKSKSNKEGFNARNNIENKSKFKQSDQRNSHKKNFSNENKLKKNEKVYSTIDNGRNKISKEGNKKKFSKKFNKHYKNKQQDSSGPRTNKNKGKMYTSKK